MPDPNATPEIVATVRVIDPATGGSHGGLSGARVARAGDAGDTFTLTGDYAEWLTGHWRAGFVVEVGFRDGRGRWAAYRGEPRAEDAAEGTPYTVTVAAKRVGA